MMKLVMARLPRWWPALALGALAAVPMAGAAARGGGSLWLAGLAAQSCAALANVRAWTGHITLAYSYSSETPSQSATFHGGAAYSVTLTSLPFGGGVSVGGYATSWTGTNKGTAHIAIEVHDKESPSHLITIKGDGSLWHSGGIDLANSQVLRVDPDHCRYEFETSARLHAVDSLVGATEAKTQVVIGGILIPTKGAPLSGHQTVALPRQTFDLTRQYWIPCVGLVSEPLCDRGSGIGSVTWSFTPAGAAPTPGPTLTISAASLLDLDNTPLRFLSVSPCTPAYCGGNGDPRVHGTITVRGEKGDALTSLVLEVGEGSTVAEARLVPAAATALLRPFGDDGEVAIDTPQLLFDLPGSEAARINQTTDGRVTLTLKATSLKGGEASLSLGSVPKLVLYPYTDGQHRYGPRDPNKGGDGWVKPSVLPVAEHFTDLLWSDFSNMNGGSFYPPHKSHQSGNDIDGRFADGSYNPHSAATAMRMLAYLNDPTYGSRIICAFATYAKTPTDAFWNTIKGKKLRDGRQATLVILSIPGHGEHFHWRITDSYDPRFTACPKKLADD